MEQEGTGEQAYFDSAKFGRLLDVAMGLANDSAGMDRETLAGELAQRGFGKLDERKIGEIINDNRGTRADEMLAFVDILQPPGGVGFFANAIRMDYRERIYAAAARR